MTAALHDVGGGSSGRVMAAPPRIFDRALHAKRLGRASGAYEGFLKDRTAADIAERVAAINRDFPVAVDLGARTGAFRRALAENPGNRVDRLVETDLSAGMLTGRMGLAADEERLPFGPGGFDLAVSSLALHWVNDLVGALVQIRRALKPDGLFIGALLGGSTLTELRQSLSAAEERARGGVGPRVSPFIDAPDGAALLQRAGFALPVVDTDKVTVLYDHPLKLLADLRAMGETSALVDRPLQPLTRRILADMAAIYADRFSTPDGRIVATFEIVTLTGWAPSADQPRSLARGSAKMRLADALRPEAF